VKFNGKNLGFLYPAQGPVVQLMGPRKFRDQLAYTNLPILPLPLPSLDSLVKDTSVSPQDKEQIAANLLAAEQVLKEHARDLSNKLGLFMDTVAGGVNRLDSFLGFHMDLFGHCDGEVTDLMRDKAATLFSPPYRSAVKGRAGDGGKAGDGLLGGETAVRSRLTDATKEDELLAKTVHKGFKGARKNYRGNQKSKGKRKSRSRSRRRSRTRSRSRSRSSRRSRHSGAASGSGKQNGRNKNKNNKKKQNKDKDETEKEKDSAKSSNTSR